MTSFRLANLLTPMVHKLESLEEIVGALPILRILEYSYLGMDDYGGVA